MSHHDDAPRSHCANCGAALAVDPHPRYCPLCGQETRLHPPSFGEFLHEFIGHYVALEGALWRTLGLLLFRPGRLTLAYLAGQRRRYVLPLRVYLSASFLFFLVARFLAGGPDPGQALQIDRPTAAAAAAQVRGGYPSDVETWLNRCTKPAACGWLETRAARAMRRMSTAEGTQAVTGRMASAMPYAVFLMVPVFAGLLQFAWRRSGLSYGAHFVLALHLHAFAFLVLLAADVLPAAVDGLAALLIAAHAVLAARRVYGVGWPGTVARSLAVGLVYGLLLVLGTVALLTLSIFAAAGA
ncbi:MAG: DUF3667 domain-containing protein [Burkholderiaceae bacterium]|nr:DUF3667 domain-containing protein [Rhodoferax sp.]MCP5284234.1 DUF3667 domain-containing protein [Burkholderiaceae bacterium]